MLRERVQARSSSQRLRSGLAAAAAFKRTGHARNPLNVEVMPNSRAEFAFRHTAGMRNSAVKSSQKLQLVTLFAPSDLLFLHQRTLTSARAGKRASERESIAQGSWSDCGVPPQLAAAAGLAPDVECRGVFQLKKPSFISHFEFGYIIFLTFSLGRSGRRAPLGSLSAWRARVKRDGDVQRSGWSRLRVSAARELHCARASTATDTPTSLH